jgi:hypothetical protein
MLPQINQATAEAEFSPKKNAGGPPMNNALTNTQKHVSNKL